MLGSGPTAKGYIDACRSRVNADVAAYRKVAAAAKKQAAAFKATFFNNLVLALDHSFVHRFAHEGAARGRRGSERVPCLQS